VLDDSAVLYGLVLLDELLGAAQVVLRLRDRTGDDADVELRLGKSPAGGEDQGQRYQERCFGTLSHGASFGIENIETF